MKSRFLPALGKRINFFLHSIRFRLVLWFAVILAVVLAAFSGFIYYNQSRDIHGAAEYRMERKLAAMEATLTLTSTGFRLPNGVLQDTDVLMLVGPDGSVMASQGSIPTTDAAVLAQQAVQQRMSHMDANDGYAAWSEGRSGPLADYLFVTVP